MRRERRPRRPRAAKLPSEGQSFTVEAEGFSLPWRGLSHCMVCNALHQTGTCHVCGHSHDIGFQEVLVDGVKQRVPQTIVQGAIPWSVYVLLDQLRQECQRELEVNRLTMIKLSPRFTVVLLFWTMFEILMGGFYRAAVADLPGRTGPVLLSRFKVIGSRLDELHRALWDINFWADLEAEGYASEAATLRDIQIQRNSFMHGDPEAIDDALVQRTVTIIRPVQEGWIKLFNKRCTRLSRHVPVWAIED